MKENLFAAIEKLRLAGQRGHDYGCAYDGRAPLEWCDCGAKEINAKVDAAAEMLVAEIRGQNPTGQAARKEP